MDCQELITDNLENIKSCTVPKENWCPTCKDAYEVIARIATIAAEDQKILENPIKDAYERNKRYNS